MIDKTDLWIVIVALAVGSFGLRFLFLGLIGDRAMPEWIMRHLRYTAVASAISAKVFTGPLAQGPP